MRVHVKNILIIIGLYTLAIVLYCYFHYKDIHNQSIGGIDKKLLTAIHATRAIIGQDFHDLVFEQSTISPEQDFEMGMKLYEFAKDVGVEYVYSLKRFDGEVVFVVSGATADEISTGNYEPAYLTRYPEMDDAVERAFTNHNVETAEYSDRWGTFRSMYVPFNTQSGDVYVIAADVSIEEVKSAVFRSVFHTFLAASILGLLLIPLMVLLIKSMRREWNIKYQSMFNDELTGLPNRNQLLKDLDESENIHLALIDIKGFSDVTNTYGPAIGDHILKQFACRLNDFHHHKVENYQAYRVAGDLFATMVNQPLSKEDVQIRSEFLINHLTQHDYQINNNDYTRLALTLGGVNQNEDAFMLADMALHEAKRREVESFVYDSRSTSLPEVYKNNAHLKQQLQLALDEDRLVPFFQPIINAKNNQIAKYECLARIIDEDGEVIITPDVFLPVARQTRLYAEITHRMVAKSIAAVKKGNFIISINLSISDIMNGATRYYLLNAVKESAAADRIQFEILETEAIQDKTKVLTFIRKLQKLGARVGIDDLGRSYSNFDRLTFLPVDFIKIDGSIITSIGNDKDAQTVTKNIVDLAHRQNIKVTAEYCFNEATTKMAVALGVDYLQGFYCGKPSKSTHKE